MVRVLEDVPLSECAASGVADHVHGVRVQHGPTNLVELFNQSAHGVCICAGLHLGETGAPLVVQQHMPVLGEEVQPILETQAAVTRAPVQDDDGNAAVLRAQLADVQPEAAHLRGIAGGAAVLRGEGDRVESVVGVAEVGEGCSDDEGEQGCAWWSG